MKGAFFRLLHCYHQDVADQRQIRLNKRTKNWRLEDVVDEKPVDPELETTPTQLEPGARSHLNAARFHCFLRFPHCIQRTGSAVRLREIESETSQLLKFASAVRFTVELHDVRRVVLFGVHPLPTVRNSENVDVRM